MQATIKNGYKAWYKQETGFETFTNFRDGNIVTATFVKDDLYKCSSGGSFAIIPEQFLIFS